MNKIFFLKKVIIIFSMVLILSLAASSRIQILGKHVNIIFRYDDFSERSSSEMSLKVIDSFRKAGTSVTFSVIPFVGALNTEVLDQQETLPLSAEKINILKAGVEDGTVDVALHGYSHQTIYAETFTEFAGLDYNSQLEKLSTGKKYLEDWIDAPIFAFVPPWNSYDQNSITALQQLDFTTLSADSHGYATKDSSLNYLPATTHIPELINAVKAAKASSNMESTIVVLFHEYDFQEIDQERGIITYQEFSDTLNWLQFQKNLRILSLSQAIEVIPDLSVNRFSSNKQHNSLAGLLPSFWRMEASMIYNEAHTLPKRYTLIAGFYAAILGMVIVLSFIIGRTILPKFPVIKNVCLFGSLALSVFACIYAFRDLAISFNGMTISAGLIGVSIGLWAAVFKGNQKTSRRNQ